MSNEDDRSGLGNTEDPNVEGGCFSLSFARPSSEGGAKLSSETKRRIAAFRFPASSLAATDLAREGIAFLGGH